MTPYSEERAAVLRLIQEINGFSDRPDYCPPVAVRNAVELLGSCFCFTDRERYSYSPDEADA